MEKQVTKEIILQMVDDMVNKPEYDDKGKVDSGWVSMHKLRVETYVKMLNGDGEDINIDVDI